MGDKLADIVETPSLSGHRSVLVFLILFGVLLFVSACGGQLLEEAGVEVSRVPEQASPDVLEAKPIESPIVSSADPEPPAATPLPAVLEERLLVLEWPSRIRTGDSDLIVLTLELDDEGNITPTALYGDHLVRGEPVQVPNLYDTHNVVAQARLDVAGMDYIPRGEISEPMRPGVPVRFSWSVLPENVGAYRGTIWIHLQFVPIDGSETSRRVLSAQIVDINAVNMFGIGGTPARIFGAVGVVAGAFLSMDKIGGVLWKFFKSMFQSADSRSEES